MSTTITKRGIRGVYLCPEAQEISLDMQQRKAKRPDARKTDQRHQQESSFLQMAVGKFWCRLGFKKLYVYDKHDNSGSHNRKLRISTHFKDPDGINIQINYPLEPFGDNPVTK